MSRPSLLPLLALTLLSAAVPARADWMLLYEKATGKILIVQMMPPDEALAHLKLPGPRPGTARLHWKGSELPVPATSRVTPQGQVAFDERPAPILTVVPPLVQPAPAISAPIANALPDVPASFLPRVRRPPAPSALERLRALHDSEVGLTVPRPLPAAFETPGTRP
ncbi:MAG: hypothetical protein HY303_09665 [Candidatus Wallbacteria bacterium]|nr:hypothetical protein [Candidatus Wallbacteria bacterium]